MNLAFPGRVFSLSHIALPFPPDDRFYGYPPEPPGADGIRLAGSASMGERDVLAVTSDAFARLSANPFFPYLIERLERSMEEDAERSFGAGR